MPKATQQGPARGSELPSTLRRSDDLAKRTFATVHDAALDEYGDEERAQRVAYSAVKHTHEKVGDRWEPKHENGPSDPQAAEVPRPMGRPMAAWTPMPPKPTSTMWRAGSASAAARR